MIGSLVDSCKVLKDWLRRKFLLLNDFLMVFFVWVYKMWIYGSAVCCCQRGGWVLMWIFGLLRDQRSMVWESLVPCVISKFNV